MVLNGTGAFQSKFEWFFIQLTLHTLLPLQHCMSVAEQCQQNHCGLLNLDLEALLAVCLDGVHPSVHLWKTHRVMLSISRLFLFLSLCLVFALDSHTSD